MFRLKDGRFEQIGQAWLKHGFTALAGSVCGTCTLTPNGSSSGRQLLRSVQQDAQRRPEPGSARRKTSTRTPASFSFRIRGDDDRATRSSSACRSTTPIWTQALNAGALYVVEGQYVTHDDAAAQNHPNNASYRPVTVTAVSGIFSLSLTGTTVREKAGIQAWKATDPSVTRSNRRCGRWPVHRLGEGDVVGWRPCITTSTRCRT